MKAIEMVKNMVFITLISKNTENIFKVVVAVKSFRLTRLVISGYIVKVSWVHETHNRWTKNRRKNGPGVSVPLCHYLPWVVTTQEMLFSSA